MREREAVSEKEVDLVGERGAYASRAEVARADFYSACRLRTTTMCLVLEQEPELVLVQALVAAGALVCAALSASIATVMQGRALQAAMMMALVPIKEQWSA